MKKLFGLLVLALITVALVGCSFIPTKANESSAKAKKTVNQVEDNEIDEIDLYDSGEYTITFWTIWGQSKSAFLDEMITEFEQYMLDTYKITVNIEATSQSDYSTLLEKTNKAITAGNKSAIPNLVIGYPDHFAGYLKSLALVSLDPYIDSTKYGVNRDDYIKAYMDENNQFGGTTYSLPLTKSQEVMLYNKTALDGIGKTIPYDKPITWSTLFSYWADLQKYTENYANFQYLVNYDSTDNMFINFARQMNAKYTTTKGELLVTDESTVTMLTWIRNQFQKKLLSVPLNYADTATYGSDYFQQQYMPFTIGSTAGASYDIPTELTYSAETGTGVRFIFETCVAMVPQFDIEDTTRSVVQQGPNICMLNAGDAEEDLIAWLFIKYLTDMEQYSPDDADADDNGFITGQDNSARFAIGTGYFPVTYKAYQSTLYQDYMSIAKRYFENGYKKDGLNFTKKEEAQLVYSEVAYIAYLQSDWLRYDPAFAATSKLFGSATIRQNAGSCIEKIAKDNTYDPLKALQEMDSQCRIG